MGFMGGGVPYIYIHMYTYIHNLHTHRGKEKGSIIKGGGVPVGWGGVYMYVFMHRHNKFKRMYVYKCM